ncbi:keratin-associated protein 10-6-like isoform X4 [Pezoporus occidentalis]|uniref:keratin-associated protein 10-6-like isoform X4 n=1 Tax=Pezoporus occidentalis TaxID=407982 RepID=UPI002F90CAA4
MTPAALAGTSAASESAGFAAPPRHKRNPAPARRQPPRGSSTPAPSRAWRTRTAWGCRSAARWAAALPAWSRCRGTPALPQPPRRSPSSRGAARTRTVPPPRCAATSSAAGSATHAAKRPPRPQQPGRRERGARVTGTAAAGRCAATAGARGPAAPCTKRSPASALPVLGCSPVMTAEPGAGTTPGVPVRRSAACVAVTTSACPRPELHCLLSPEKPGICPVAPEAPPAAAPCGTACAGDWQCPGDEKCCSSTCGHVCSAPERDKPGECPRVRPRQAPEPCEEEEDSCAHDRDCPRQEKCCFSGCAMRCARPAREHPGQCPRAEPCWDPRRRRRSQCLDDSICGRAEKCCNTGCAWECVAVPRESWDRDGGQCMEECETDSQCPRGQRCTSNGCGHVCTDIPGGRVGTCPIPREAGTCLDLCSSDEECPWGHKCCSNGCGHVCTPASLQERDAAAVPWHGAERCPQECEADSQCPRGQRCTHSGCGHVCTDTPRDAA